MRESGAASVALRFSLARPSPQTRVMPAASTNHERPAGDTRPGRSGPPVHPLSALLLLVVDNLWNLGDWAVLTWIITVPLSFLSVFFPGLFLQRYAHADGWGQSIGKALMLATLAAIPTSMAGTPIGMAFLAWAGVNKWRGRNDLEREAADVVPRPAAELPAPASPATLTPVLDIEATQAETSRHESRPAPEPPRRRGSLVVAVGVCLLLVAVFFGAAALLVKYTADRAAGLTSGLRDLAGGFSNTRITQTFTAALPDISRTIGGNLELATATATESFTQKDELAVAWNLLSLGTTISEISVPVTYRYHLRLRDTWRLEVEGTTCRVYAPEIRASLPPAIHTHRMEKRSTAGWGRFNAQDQMSELERSLTPTVSQYATDPRHLNLIREDCRKTVGEFVRDWLLSQGQWGGRKFSTIHVFFPGETNLALNPPPPVIKLN